MAACGFSHFYRILFAACEQWCVETWPLSFVLARPLTLLLFMSSFKEGKLRKPTSSPQARESATAARVKPAREAITRRDRGSVASSSSAQTAVAQRHHHRIHLYDRTRMPLPGFRTSGLLFASLLVPALAWWWLSRHQPVASSLRSQSQPALSAPQPIQRQRCRLGAER